MKRFAFIILALVLVASCAAMVKAQTPSIRERVAAIRSALATSQTNLKQYEWIQTTIVKVNGEEKSRKQQRLYYGADGALQKVDVSSSPQPRQRRGLRGRLTAKKAKELSDYTKKAVELLSAYVPPNPGKLQAAADAGRAIIQVLEPGKRARINFADYLKKGDNLGVEIDLVNNLPLGLTVSSYMDDPKDPVGADVVMGRLNDGTVYPSRVTLDAKSKGIQIVVDNTGYAKRTGGP